MSDDDIWMTNIVERYSPDHTLQSLKKCALQSFDHCLEFLQSHRFQVKRLTRKRISYATTKDMFRKGHAQILP